MSKIEIFIVEPDTIQRRQEIIESALKSSFDLQVGGLKFLIDKSGKPRLALVDGHQIFYSFSHARKVSPPFGIAAVSLDIELGIDIELWPVGLADPDFLQAISTSEDEGALVALNFCQRDSGIALWVIKEAALKCTGEVMIDPRYLAVDYEGAGAFLVRSSALAGAPHPEIRVRLFVLKGAHLPLGQFIFGVAMSADCDAGVVIDPSLSSPDQRWIVEGCVTL